MELYNYFFDFFLAVRWSNFIFEKTNKYKISRIPNVLIIRITINQTFWFNLADFQSANAFQTSAQLSNRTSAHVGNPNVTVKSASAINYVINQGL